MILRATMGSIYRNLNHCSSSNEDTPLIECVDSWELQIHELWCLVLDNSNHKVYPTAQVEVISGTVGEFVTDYLSENGRIIQIIGQLFINNRVQFWGVPNQSGGSRLPFICNLQALVDATGWGSANNSNQKWGGSMSDANIITNFSWGDSVDPFQSYLLWSPVKPRAA